MPHKLKLAPPHYEGLRPRTQADRRSALRAVACALLAIAFVAGLWQLQRHWQTQREDHWSAAQATILDVRPILATQSGSYGRMLYTTQVLLKFETPRGTTQQWVTTRNLPTTLTALQANALRWKGTRCIVRWNPSNPKQIDAELS